MVGYHLPEVQVWMGHSTIQVTERYAHLAPKKASTDKLSDARLAQFYGTSTAPEPTKVVHLAELQSKNTAVALPDLVTGPVFKTSRPYQSRPTDTKAGQSATPQAFGMAWYSASEPIGSTAATLLLRDLRTVLNNASGAEARDVSPLLTRQI